MSENKRELTEQEKAYLEVLFNKEQEKEQPKEAEKKVAAPVVYDESQITTFSDLEVFAQGKIIRFPDFAEGQMFIARVKRPSMLMLAKSGKIPNALLSTANDLFAKGGEGIDTKNESMMKDMYDVMAAICEASLLAPTVAEFEKAGQDLSDDQMSAIFNYTQTGVKSLETFPQE